LFNRLLNRRGRHITRPDLEFATLEWNSRYYLLQIGHLHMQLLHHNSLHLALAKQYGQPSVLALWGALKKIPQRLLEALRYYLFDELDFNLAATSA
jgi:hypothetical protein